jgi:hypothetical protein
MPNIREFADARFKVSEFGNNSFFISTLENGPASNTILNVKNSFLMTLKPGTSFEDAKALVQHLNQHIEQISIQS